MKRTKYPKLKDYEGIEIADGEIFRFACCDCGSVHDMVIVDEDNKKHGLAFRRNKRASGQLRRHLFGYLQQKKVGLQYRMVRNEY